MNVSRSILVAVALVTSLTVASGPSAVAAPSAPATLQEGPGVAFGPDVEVGTPSIDWGPELEGNVRFVWNVDLHNPNDRTVLVRVRLNFLDEAGETVAQEWVAGSLAAGESRTFTQTGSLPAATVETIVEAEADPVSWWANEPYKIRTLYAFLTGFRTVEILFVLEDWLGLPVEAPGVADLYIYEIGELRANVPGGEGAMRRDVRQIYARRFFIEPRHYEERRIGFLSADYEPPTVTIGPLHLSAFDEEPRGHEGLVRLVFRTERGLELVAEDDIYF